MDAKTLFHTEARANSFELVSGAVELREPGLEKFICSCAAAALPSRDNHVRNQIFSV